MSAVTAAGVSMAAAVLVAVTGYSGQVFLAAAVGLVVLVMAIGWGPLLDLPDPRGSALLVMATGAVGIAMALRGPEPTRPLAWFSSVLAVSVIWFWLVRHVGKCRVIPSVTSASQRPPRNLLAPFCGVWQSAHAWFRSPTRR